MTSIAINALSLRLGNTLAVDNVNLKIASGELFFLLGPSGCGKTTLLHMIAGLLEPAAGTIEFDGRDVTRVATQQRNAVMCFQSYALWPHLTLAQNIAFGLDVRGIGKAEREQRVERALQLVQLQDFAQRRPAELSGGQQQRVAIARAIAVRPACLLLDEPLSNLDARLRKHMRTQLRYICKSTGLTTIYVTHDQQEALSIADRIAIMKSGQVLQVGTPRELYEHPKSVFVAEFLGHAQIVKATVQALQSGQAPRATGVRLKLNTPLGPLFAWTTYRNVEVGQQLMLSLRPEQMQIFLEPLALADSGNRIPSDNRVTARHLDSSFLGNCSEHQLQVEGVKLTVQCSPPKFDLPQEVSLHLPEKQLRVLLD